MDLEKTISDSIESGRINRSTHDQILSQIQSDGVIDEAEKKLLSKLFNAIQSGKILLEDELKIPSNNLDQYNSQKNKLESLKKEAVNRSELTERKTNEYNIKNTAKKQSTVTDYTAVDKPLHKEPAQILPTEQCIEPRPFENKLLNNINEKRESGKTFVLKNDRILDVFLNGMSWIKTGSMIGYYGSVKFTREGIFEHGLGKTIKKAVTKEGTTLTRASGLGNLYLADQGKKISIHDLGAHSMVVNGENLLAFEQDINWDITWLKQLAAYAKGGMFNVRLSGNGSVAITTIGDPLVLRVKPNEPLMTDIQATVAWSGGLHPQFKTDISSDTLIGRGSGESIQMKFEGDGFVIIQPFEEI